MRPAPESIASQATAQSTSDRPKMSEEAKERRRAATRHAWADPKLRARWVAAFKKSWADPEKRKRTIEKRRATLEKKRN